MYTLIFGLLNKIKKKILQGGRQSVRNGPEWSVLFQICMISF
jgi:hypothetical protein